MKNIQVNKISFRGQFGEALESFNKGEKITIRNFNNGTWEPTVKVTRFINLLKKANIKFNIVGDSIRTTVICKKRIIKED